MKNCDRMGYFIVILLIAVVLPLAGCRYDENSIRIQRFEPLDIYNNRNDNIDERLKNQLSYQAYLISGYEPRFDADVQKRVDKFVCDSIFPNLEFYASRTIRFYKESQNTNRENFQVQPIKRKLIRADKDLLYSYLFSNHFLLNGNDSVIVNNKVIHEFSKEDIYVSFKCN